MKVKKITNHVHECAGNGLSYTNMHINMHNTNLEWNVCAENYIFVINFNCRDMKEDIYQFGFEYYIIKTIIIYFTRIPVWC